MLQALDVFLRVQSSFPHATVQAAGFDGFVSDLLRVAPSLDLPVVTGEVRGRAAGSQQAFAAGSGPLLSVILLLSMLLLLLSMHQLCCPVLCDRFL